MTYTSPDERYTQSRAEVYVDGLFMGEAIKMPYTPPLPGQEDGGLLFAYDLVSQGVGINQIEVVVFDGDKTRTTSAGISFTKSALFDHEVFITELYSGLVGRPAETEDIELFLPSLENGSLERGGILDEIRGRQEFRNSVNLMLTHKVVEGSWSTMQEILAEVNASSGGGQVLIGADDHSNTEVNATVVSMNEIIRGNIETPNDVDVFRIDSLGPNANGILTISVDAGHPNVTQQDVLFAPLPGDFNVVQQGGALHLSIANRHPEERQGHH